MGSRSLLPDAPRPHSARSAPPSTASFSAWLLEHSNTNDRDRFATRNLLTAVQSADVRSVDRLLLSGVSVNCQDERGWTPLIVAVQCHNAGMVQRLLQAQADARVSDTYGQSALDWAMKEKQKDIEQTLRMHDPFGQYDRSFGQRSASLIRPSRQEPREKERAGNCCSDCRAQ